MYKVVSFLKKRDGLSFDQFRDYYENNHVPLILSLAPALLVYRRRYLPQENEITKSENSINYDVTTEKHRVWQDRDPPRTQQHPVPPQSNRSAYPFRADVKDAASRVLTGARCKQAAFGYGLRG